MAVHPGPSPARVAGRLLAAVVVAWLALVPAWTPVRAADRVDFGAATASSSFGRGVTFSQPVDLPFVPERVELLVTTPGATGPLATEVLPPTTTGPTTLRGGYGEGGHLLPNTPLAARWRITAPDGTTQLGPPVETVYADDRFEWRTVSGPIVRVHWYQGGAAFGRQALRVAEEAVAQAEELLGVTETEPIDFFMYADQASFYEALGPATRENVGGMAVAGIRTLFGLAPETGSDYVLSAIVPHELTHLVFDTAVDNPYNAPPKWLDEGVAVYLSQGYDEPDRRLVDDAARDGTLIPLQGLAGAFPTKDGFFLAYAEAVAAVDFLVRTYGQDALVSLIGSYADGTSDDEAFRAALGVDVDGFDAAWFADLGVAVPEPLGPRPDVVGPLPPGWAAPGGTPVPGASATPSGTPTPGPVAPSGGPTAILALVAAIGAIAIAVVGWIVIRRSRRPATPSVGDVPSFGDVSSAGVPAADATPPSLDPSEQPEP